MFSTTDSALRARAARLGYAVVRGRRESIAGFRGYWLCLANSGGVVASWPFGMSLEELADEPAVRQAPLGPRAKSAGLG